MATPFLLIDGYNLLHAAGLARRSYGPGMLEVTRSRLLQQLSIRLTADVRSRTTVVFDAFGSDSNTRRNQTEYGLQILFAPAGTDADSELERLIQQHDAPRQVLVVSSDHRVQKAARKRRCRFSDSEIFWEETAAEVGASTRPGSGPRRAATKSTDLQTMIDTAQADLELQSRNPAEVFDADYLSDLEDELQG